MAEELEKLTGRVQNIEGGKGIEGLNYGDLCIQPDVELPKGYKLHKFEMFDGTGDPKVHLRTYCDKLIGVGKDERIRMKLFMRSLTGDALSCAGDNVLAAVLKRMEEMENENKSLKEQMKEHQERVDKIPGAPKLLPKRDAGRFVEQPYREEAAPHAIPKIFKMPPYLRIYDGMTDPEDHVTHYITAVKDNDLNKEQVSSILLKTIEVVYALEKLGTKVKWPPKMRSDPSTRKFDALCEFHQEHGHKIEDCQTLRLEVANLLQQGHLKELLSEKGRNTLGRGRECPGPPKLPSPACTINMIIGGSEDASINGIKFIATHKLKRSITHERYDRLEKSIILNESDTDSLTFPHNDALVITLRILDTDVRRIMVDDGSGACIIHPRVLADAT
ncbi:uncharacterized protein LOC142175934 [Nicotiana tabacum]|uniref:Uncharacterized protein LOC142175934 n=1 Tax=Nicotiana tabacum TaxID=4097 RepID=A0AC58TPB7_TOBAC